MQVVMLRSVIDEANRLGISLQTMSDEGLLKLCPSRNTLASGLALTQSLLDLDAEDALSKCSCITIINDAGNKGNTKLTQRFVVGYSHEENRLVVKHVGATPVASGELHVVVKEDLTRLKIEPVKAI